MRAPNVHTAASMASTYAAANPAVEMAPNFAPIRTASARSISFSAGFMVVVVVVVFAMAVVVFIVTVVVSVPVAVAVEVADTLMMTHTTATNTTVSILIAIMIVGSNTVPECQQAQQRSSACEDPEHSGGRGLEGYSGASQP
eukprot:m.357016 g.357016  ORF g.357016 m.357016 type:complete len:142 (-) comp17683_c0_seq1:70-495(-)